MINVFEKVSNLVWAINSTIFGIAVFGLTIGLIIFGIKEYKNERK